MADSIFSGVPGGNIGGTQTMVPTTGSTPAPALGGNSNPLNPEFPGGTSAPPLTFPAYEGSTSLTGLENMGTAGGLGFPSNYLGANTKGFHNAGYPNAIAGLLASFLQQGAGYNPQVIQQLWAALQPQIAAGQANVMEQFGAEGLSSSSPAAISLAGYNSQVALDMGQIASQMYEQSIQNYMSVLEAGRKPPSQQGGIGALLGGGGNLLSGISDLFSSGGGGGSTSSAANSGGDYLSTLGDAGISGGGGTIP